ncbi:hypothetical protein JCM33374_g2184 [Metschnikowia sp. JCM 33374]|nr:hypothetical protein JCM33374_g2184 [Metschnikowia sp. JCM 33374]
MSEAVTARVWNGSVHVRIVYENTDFLLDAKRVAYFASYFSQMADFFRIATGVQYLPTQPVWLEYEDVPLKWNLPIGLLYDLLYLPSGPISSSSSSSSLPSSAYKHPWKLVLKVSCAETPYPSHSIIPFDSAGHKPVDYNKMLNRVLINSLKQSCYVLNGNSRAVLGLSDDDTRGLCRSMATHDLTVYTSISKKLVAAPKTGRQRIPLKLYIAGSDILLQAPVWTKDDAGNDSTLSQVIKHQLAEVSTDNMPSFPCVYIHGINVDVLLDEPVLHLWMRLRYMDNFLYVVLVMKG